MASKIKGWALLGAGAGIAASISGAVFYDDLIQKAHATETAAPAATPAVPVTVAAVEQRDVTIWQDFSGRLEAVNTVDLRSRVAGAIQSVDFREGSLVKSGDVLVQIDPAPYAAAVNEARSLVASAKAKLELANTELERGRRLLENKTISDSDYAQRSSSHSEALANLWAAEAALSARQLDLDYTSIRAPISGRIGKLEITAGNLVAAGSGSPSLARIVSSGPIYATFDASEELVARILSKLPATDEALPAIDLVPVEIGTLSDQGTPIHGKLQLIDNAVDAASGTINVRAVFDNPGNRLIPGQFVRVRMGEPKAESRVMISERAIGTDQDKKFVFVVDAANTAVYRQVELGSSIDRMRVVEKGLAPGDRIVTNGLQRIRAGVVVDPQTEVADAK